MFTDPKYSSQPSKHLPSFSQSYLLSSSSSTLHPLYSPHTLSHTLPSLTDHWCPSRLLLYSPKHFQACLNNFYTILSQPIPITCKIFPGLLSPYTPSASLSQDILGLFLHPHFSLSCRSFLLSPPIIFQTLPSPSQSCLLSASLQTPNHLFFPYSQCYHISSPLSHRSMATSLPCYLFLSKCCSVEGTYDDFSFLPLPPWWRVHK